MVNIENNGTARFSLKGEHVKIRAIKLITSTDITDTLVTETSLNLFRGNADELSGHIFILTDILTDVATVFIIPTPDCVMPRLRVEDKKIEIKTFGYPVSVGYTNSANAERLCRDWYRLHYSPETLIAMSNTWGDRNGRTRVNEEFVKREIDSGADVGLDVVQIDDGWQKGIPETYDEANRRVFEGDFWEIKKEVFPSGLLPLSEYAKERGVELGLWFAPHSRECFEYFERDLDVLKKAYCEWGFRYFKLDMLQLINDDHCMRMLDFLDGVFSFGDGVSVELDVTADKRLGYLAPAPYGIIFVENRYTAWANYYPHRTLRNLWSLSRFIPSSKLQFELVNPELYTEAYSADDPLRPELYGIDYLFASVMFSNPLFWMETQFLSEKSREKLKSIVPIWRKHRDELVKCDVRPIGEEPSGKSMTGFIAEGNGKAHLLVFREATPMSSFVFSLDKNYAKADLVASDSDVICELLPDGVKVSFGKMRSYAWFTLYEKE